MIETGAKFGSSTSACGGDPCEVTSRSLTADVKDRRDRRCRQRTNFRPVTRTPEEGQLRGGATEVDGRLGQLRAQNKNFGAPRNLGAPWGQTLVRDEVSNQTAEGGGDPCEVTKPPGMTGRRQDDGALGVCCRA